jgi:hypothetical protein
MLVCAMANAQSVTGVVTDSGGEPLVGASVKNMSQTGIGAATDINGTFSLKAGKGDIISVLVHRFFNQASHCGCCKPA